jgi:hypothetical protein
LKTVSYFKLRVYYYNYHSNSCFRLGQLFINFFIKREDNTTNYNELWNEADDTKAETQILKLIHRLQWDMNNLIPIKELPEEIHE